MEYNVKLTVHIQGFQQPFVGYTSPEWVTAEDDREAETALDELQGLINGSSIFSITTLAIFDVNDTSIEYIIPRVVLEHKMPAVWATQLLKR